MQTQAYIHYIYIRIYEVLPKSSGNLTIKKVNYPNYHIHTTNIMVEWLTLLLRVR
jgi:hypothetical protein